MVNNKEKLIIIGSGPAALTAAIYASRANLHPLLIEGDHPGGQLIYTTAIENWPGETSIMGPTLMQNMKQHATHFGTRFISDEVVAAHCSKQPFMITTKKGLTFHTDALIIATGAAAKRLGIPGEKEFWAKGVSTCAVCDGAFYHGKPVIIVGGGDTAMEYASFMTKFTDKITIVHMLDTLTASIAMQQRVLNNPHIRILYNSSISQINGNSDQGVTDVTIVHKPSNTSSNEQTSAVFIAIGYTPNSSVFKGQLAIDEWGYITVTDNTKTSIDGIFAAGDVVDFHYRQAITAAGYGCMAALDAQRWLASLE